MRTECGEATAVLCHAVEYCVAVSQRGAADYCGAGWVGVTAGVWRGT